MHSEVGAILVINGCNREVKMRVNEVNIQSFGRDKVCQTRIYYMDNKNLKNKLLFSSFATFRAQSM